MNDVLENLLRNPRVWRGSGSGGVRQYVSQYANVYPSGYTRLDRHLPGGGFPRQALTEILLEHYGSGELKLLMPALARLSRSGKGVMENDIEKGNSDENGNENGNPGWIAWIAPPFQPYPPALLQWGINLDHMLIVHPGQKFEALWAAEQALSSGHCAAVLLWAEVADRQASRRLQLAAEKGQSWAIAFRPLEAGSQCSAAALRIALTAGEQGTDVRILKSRGGRPVSISAVIQPDHSYAHAG